MVETRLNIRQPNSTSSQWIVEYPFRIFFSLSLSLFVEESGEFSLRKIARYEGGKYRFALSPVDNSISSFRLLAVFEEGRVR